MIFRKPGMCVPICIFFSKYSNLSIDPVYEVSVWLSVVEAASLPEILPGALVTTAEHSVVPFEIP